MKWFVFEWAKPLGNYLIRWRLDFYWFSFRLHKWLCSDDQRAYHSHANNFLIIGLKGEYRDWSVYPAFSVRNYKAPFIRYFKRNYKHSIEIEQSPTWTFVITFGRPKHWDFYLKDTLKRKTRDKYFLEHGHHVCD